jgi:hypothetical protein
VKLIIIADSDISLCNDHMDAMFAFFPNTEFWIQNWLGGHERCVLLPIGSSRPMETLTSKKQKMLAISFAKDYSYSKARTDFYAFLDKTPKLNAFILPILPFEDYCQTISERHYQTSPMGVGYDTFRFWESLACQTVPIVKDHYFYERLSQHYPDVPMLRLQSWSELPSLLPSLQPHIFPNMPYITEDYWLTRLQTVIQ